MKHFRKINTDFLNLDIKYTATYNIYNNLTF